MLKGLKTANERIQIPVLSCSFSLEIDLDTVGILRAE